MNEPTTGYQEGPGSGEPPRGDRDRTIVSDVVIAKIAGIAAQDVEGVRMGGSGDASNAGSFADGVGWDGQPRDVSVRVADKEDRKSTRLNSSHANISYAVFCLKKKNN